MPADDVEGRIVEHWSTDHLYGRGSASHDSHVAGTDVMSNVRQYIMTKRAVAGHEFDLVVHREKGYAGWRDGVTRLKKLLECPDDAEGVRVWLPSGELRIASPSKLDSVTVDEYVLLVLNATREQLEEWRRQEPEERHRQHVLASGKSYIGTMPSAKQPRDTHCYKCNAPLSNTTHLACLTCGWIVCHCGACGCGYKPFL